MSQTSGGDLSGKARGTVARHSMLEEGQRVVVSVSGGPDSVALLLFLADLAPGMSLTLSVFHLDHMLRGAESAADAEFVRRLAEGMGLTAEVTAAGAGAAAGASRRSPQDVYREIRTGKLLAWAERWGADRVAVGHTADDQVETFLMRMVQGAGLTGLAGIPPVAGPVIRPLIEVWRHEVEAYLRLKGVTARTDRTNLEDDYLRNRIRHELLPCIVSGFGEATKAVILREVESLAGDREMFLALAAGAFEEVARVEGGSCRIDLRALAGLAPSMKRGVVREAWTRLLPGEPMLSWQHVSDILTRVAGGSSGASIDLPRRMRAEREYGDLLVGPARPPASLEPRQLVVPGRLRLDDRTVLEAERVPASEVVYGGDPDTEYARPDLAAPLEVRMSRPGDRFRPLGSPHRKKVKDFFIDEKVPRRERSAVPLVLEAGRIVWVAGYRLDDRFKVRPGDDGAVRLRLRRERA